MSKIVGVKILVNNAWIMVWMLEQQAKELMDKFKGENTSYTVGGVCALTGITWVISLSKIVAIHTITDDDTQQVQQQMTQATRQAPRPLAPSPFRASGR